MSETIIDKRGLALLQDARLNKSTAFTEKERDEFGLRGLLPPAICTQDVQVRRAVENMRRKAYDIERFIYLQALQHRNERLFFRLVCDHLEEIMPLIYTPTVGQACQEFASIFRQTRGLYVTAADQGRIKDIVRNWPEQKVSTIVITDGERILGLGDLGANGMGIPIGKLSLYTALAGVAPNETLPIMLDVGTENTELRDDPLYLGLNQNRLRGDAYFALVDELFEALTEAFPGSLIQFEDFATPNAYALLNRFQDQTLCFNDDIQGTAAVVLAGLYASTRITGHAFKDLRFMFLGAGSAATGIGDLLVDALKTEGLNDREARSRLSFIDRKGLVTASRTDLKSHNMPYAQDLAPMSFAEALDMAKPQVLIGATGTPGAFSQAIVEKMASNHERPVIFALSNPTDRAECTADDAYQWSGGRAIFASGSPFPPVVFEGMTFRPGQGNNAYIFPGVGLGAIKSGATRLPSNAFLVAARTLADAVKDDDLAVGAVYPPVSQIRDVSLDIAVSVAEALAALGLTTISPVGEWREVIASSRYDPYY